ncbi:MAG: Sec-independent protein translocase subunit TatA/TatB [Pirellulaceae bacterium]
MLPSIGITELVVLGVVAIVLFGKRLPEVARNVGRGYGELRKGLNELQSTINTEVDAGSPARRERDRERISGPSMDDLDEPTAPSLPPPPEDNS